VSGVLLPIHVAAGALAIVAGATALLVRKGGTIHRHSGRLFVAAMLLMGATGATLGFRQGGPADGNVLAGFVVAYFVGTALVTVRPVSPWTRRFHALALVSALGFALVEIVGGVEAWNSPRHVRNGVPAVMLFFFAAVFLLAAAGDARVLSAGAPRGGRRLARHLWRMGFALFIAAGSFLSIRARVAKVLPEPFTTGPMRLLPIVLLFGAMVYWLWRVRRRRPLAATVRNDPAPLERLETAT
jgi:hypothetical protein